MSHNPILPTVGRNVLFRGHGEQVGLYADDRKEVPGMITAVHSPTCINIMVMRDGYAATPICITSVGYDDAEEFPTHNGWRWMPYQKAVASGGIEPVKHAA